MKHANSQNTNCCYPDKNTYSEKKSIGKFLLLFFIALAFLPRVYAQGCSTLSASSTQTNVTCFGTATGSIDLTVNGGATPYAYTWIGVIGGVIPLGQSHNEDLTGLVAGTYRVTVTDANGCSVIKAVVITQAAQPLTATYVQVNPGCDSIGTVNLTVFGGVAPYSYDWTATNGGVVPTGQQNGQDMYNVIPGTYTVVITDFSGCSKTVTTVLTQSSAPLVATTTQTNVGCSGDPTGSIDLTVTGGKMPYTYSWTSSNGGTIPAGQSTGEDLSGLSAGIYSVLVTSNNGGCVTTKNILITTAKLNITYRQINQACDSAGSIRVNVNGGSPGYTYEWAATNGGIVPPDQVYNKDLRDLVAGTYTLTVTDMVGCTGTITVNITKSFDVVCPHPMFGCSHGFWKNHPEYWNNGFTYTVFYMPTGLSFTTSTNFFTYFNIAPGTGGLPTSLTMLGALQLNGGQCKAFSRDAVAALLDVASGQNVPFPAGTSDFSSLYSAIRTALLASDCNGILRSGLRAIVESCPNNANKQGDLYVNNDLMNAAENQVIAVSAYPNPFFNYTDKISFTIRSSVSGKVNLELYDLMGIKQAVLYNSYLDRNTEKVINYSLPVNNKKTLIYRFTIGDKTSSGKLLFLK